MVEPILKWAGGKRQILPQIRSSLPPEDEVNRYHEPFFGGGALFFDIGPHKRGSTINDINKRLMNFYQIVRSDPGSLIQELNKLKPPHSDPDPSLEFSEKGRNGSEIENYYYQIREIYNKRPNGEDFDEVQEAALLLYLNRTCYNGLYRENSDGEFNVPIGRHSNPNWRQVSRIMDAADMLEGIQMFSESFEYVIDLATEGDLVYFDPPYRPVSATSSFVEYSSASFGPEEQRNLRDLAVELDKQEVYVVMSNSPPIKELFKHNDSFLIHEIGAKRHINSVGEDRGKVGEIIVTNVPENNRREMTAKLDSFKADAD